MTLFNLLEVVDYEQRVKIIMESNGIIESEVSGDQASIMKMLSKETLDHTVTCIAPREERVLYIWMEETNDENA